MSIENRIIASIWCRFCIFWFCFRKPNLHKAWYMYVCKQTPLTVLTQSIVAMSSNKIQIFQYLPYFYTTWRIRQLSIFFVEVFSAIAWNFRTKFFRDIFYRALCKPYAWIIQLTQLYSRFNKFVIISCGIFVAKKTFTSRKERHRAVFFCVFL